MPKLRKPWLVWLFLFLIVFLVGQIIKNAREKSDKFIELTTSELYDYLEHTPQAISKLYINDVTKAVRGDFNSPQRQGALRFASSAVDLKEIEALALKQKVSVEVTHDNESNVWMGVIVAIAPVLIIAAVIIWFLKSLRSGALKDINVWTKASYKNKIPSTRFDDVRGIDEAIEEIKEVVFFLKNPKKFIDMGAKTYKGILLIGPPGTGKTLLARAVAGEAGVPFFSIAGSDFVQLFVGVGASRVRDLFAEASKRAPCIVFIDEIDGVGKARSSNVVGSDERDQTINALLNEMDGFESNKGVIVLAATNKPESLDEALLRPGRFDRQIVIDKPDVKGRKEILEVHSSSVKMADNVDLGGIAAITPGASGADLANLINLAAIGAVLKNKEMVDQEDLEGAVEKVLMGPEKKNKILTGEERHRVAIHEAGHALVSYLVGIEDPVKKISIIPRTTGSLGYTRYSPKDRYLLTKTYLQKMLVGAMGGAAAEKLLLVEESNGAVSDIHQATEIARRMVIEFGMSNKVGKVAFSKKAQFLNVGEQVDASPLTLLTIDKEIARFTNEAYEKAMDLLSGNREKLELLAKALEEKETISGEEMRQILAVA